MTVIRVLGRRQYAWEEVFNQCRGEKDQEATRDPSENDTRASISGKLCDNIIKCLVRLVTLSAEGELLRDIACPVEQSIPIAAPSGWALDFNSSVSSWRPGKPSSGSQRTDLPPASPS